MKNFMDNLLKYVRELANEHNIFVSVLPVCHPGEITYRYTIKETDINCYEEYCFCFDMESKDEYDTYDEALIEALTYVKDNTRIVRQNGMLTLTSPDQDY